LSGTLPPWTPTRASGCDRLRRAAWRWSSPKGAQHQLVRALTDRRIATIGHLGLTPQTVHALGGNKVQARTEAAVSQLLADARGLQEAGACALVLEAVPSEAARRVTEELSIPTIGIGAGPHCDDQVLVSTEMLGLSSDPSPRFAKRYTDLRGRSPRRLWRSWTRWPVVTTPTMSALTTGPSGSLRTFHSVIPCGSAPTLGAAPLLGSEGTLAAKVRVRPPGG
jgi:hypothetical protein